MTLQQLGGAEERSRYVGECSRRLGTLGNRPQVAHAAAERQTHEGQVFRTTAQHSMHAAAG